MIRIKLIESDQKKEQPEIVGATLLSVKEYEKYRNNISVINSSWWLCPPRNNYYSACTVKYDGNIYYYNIQCSVYGVRPTLLLNPQSSNLKIGNKVKLGGHLFTILSKDLAICDDFIGKCCFREDYNAKDVNIYEKSDVKKVVDEWFIKALCKSPDFWTEDNIDLVIDNCEDVEYRARALEFKHQLGKIGDRMDKLNKEMDILDMSDEEFQEYVKNHPEEFEGV